MKVIISYTIYEEKEIEVSNKYAILRNYPAELDEQLRREWRAKSDELYTEALEAIPADAEFCAVRDAKDDEILFEL